MSLSINDVVNVSISFSPPAAQGENLGALLILGPSPVIDVNQRVRQYASIGGVATDFSTTDPEYLAAVDFFAQAPQPTIVYIGRWAQSDTSGILYSGIFPAASQLALIASLQSVTNGSFQFTVDSILSIVDGLDFVGITNMQGIAGVINAALPNMDVASAVVASPGGATSHSYVPNDTITLGGAGPGYFSHAILTVTTTEVVSATVDVGGTGGTNGPAVVTGTTGTGTKFQANVTISGGAITAVNSIAVGGAYTVNPTSLTAEPVTGGSLSGAELTLVMGVATVSVTTPGIYTTLPTNPVAQLTTSGNGTGATFTLTGATRAGAATCVWNTSLECFQFTSDSSGTTSTVSYATVGGSGTDVSALLLINAASAQAPVNGIAAETPLACFQLMRTGIAGFSNLWYGGMFAGNGPTDDQLLAVAAYAEAASPLTVLGISTTESATLSSTSTTDLAYLLNAAEYSRTMIQYSSTDDNVIASVFGRMFTVNYTGDNTTITMKFKTEPGVTPENLTESQAAALNAKCCNVFASYSNGTAIVQQGVMSSGLFIDERMGFDNFASDLQVALFNALYESQTKIPQTDPGVHVLVTVAEGVCSQYGSQGGNGLLGPGVWSQGTIGTLVTGAFMPTGYYVYAPSVSTQSAAVRATRAAPLMQIAAQEAGAIHSASVVINVNR